MMTAEQIEKELSWIHRYNSRLDELSRKLLADIFHIASVIATEDWSDKYIWGRAKGGEQEEYFCIKLRFDKLLFVGGVPSLS